MAEPLDYEKGKNLPNLKAQFQMFSDYDRLYKILLDADRLGIEVRSNKLRQMRTYFAILEQFYFNIRPLVSTRNKTDFDGRQASLEAKTRVPNSECIEDLRQFHKELLNVKQFIGLGIPVRRDMSSRERLDAAMDVGVRK